MQSGVTHQSSPASADVEQALPRSEVELAADQVELLRLRVVQRRVGSRENRAGVGHRRAEHELIEPVRDVVMVCDRRCVTPPAVTRETSAPGRGRLLRRHARTSHQPHLKATQKPPQLDGMEVPPAVPMERTQGGVEVAVNLEGPRDIRSGDAELPGGGEHEPNGLGRAHLDRWPADPSGRSRSRHRPETQPGHRHQRAPERHSRVSSAPPPRLTSRSVAVRSDGRPHAPPGQKVATDDGLLDSGIKSTVRGCRPRPAQRILLNRCRQLHYAPRPPRTCP
jgi:hypothetical protein